MLPTVIAAMTLTLFAIVAYMLLAVLDPRYVHPRLHPLQRRLQAHMAPEWMRDEWARNEQLAAESQALQKEDSLSIFDSLFLDEPELPETSRALMSASTPTLTAASELPQAEVLLFLRAEIAVQLGIDLDVRGTTVNLTCRQYRMLQEYTGFAFDAIESPESYLGRYGIEHIHFVAKRGGFGYHSIGRQ